MNRADQIYKQQQQQINKSINQSIFNTCALTCMWQEYRQHWNWPSMQRPSMWLVLPVVKDFWMQSLWAMLLTMQQLSMLHPTLNDLVSVQVHNYITVRWVPHSCPQSMMQVLGYTSEIQSVISVQNWRRMAVVHRWKEMSPMIMVMMSTDAEIFLYIGQCLSSCSLWSKRPSMTNNNNKDDDDSFLQ